MQQKSICVLIATVKRYILDIHMYVTVMEKHLCKENLQIFYNNIYTSHG